MKNNKGFTLVEIIVVLVILAILAAATIPSMLGFVEQAKSKSLSAEARAVYVAAQAVVTEKLATATDSAAAAENLKTELATGDDVSTNPLLGPYIKNDATGKVSGIEISNGKITKLTYTKDKYQVTFENGNATFGTVSSEPAASPSESA